MNISNTKQWVLSIPILLISILLHGCIEEDITKCPQTFSLQITAFDSEMRDITADGDVESVVIFIFDENGKYVDRAVLSANEIKSRKAIHIEKFGPKRLKFIGIGNPSEADLKSLQSISSLSDISLRLSSNKGLATHPTDLFSGTLDQEVKYGVLDPPTPINLKIYRRTARANVSIIGYKDWLQRQGLSPVPDPLTSKDMEIRLVGGLDTFIPNHNTYTGNEIFYSLTGEMKSGNYSIPPFRLFPTKEGQPLVFELYVKGKKIKTFTKGTDGVQFIPETGKMLNIYIDLVNGKLNVLIKVTPWEYVHQFAEY